MRLDQFAPLVTTALPPARRQLTRARVVDLDELRAERLRPEGEHPSDAVAREARTKQSRRRQTTPWRWLHLAIPRRGEPEAAVAAESLVITVGRHRIEVRRRLTFRGDKGRPPLVADGGDPQQIERLERHIGLHDRVRLAF